MGGKPSAVTSASKREWVQRADYVIHPADKKKPAAAPPSPRPDFPTLSPVKPEVISA